MRPARRSISIKAKLTTKKRLYFVEDWYITPADAGGARLVICMDDAAGVAVTIGVDIAPNQIVSS